MAAFKLFFHVSGCCVEVVDDEARHLVAGLSFAGSHEHCLVVGQGLCEYGQVAIFFQQFEIGVSPEEINLTNILAYVGLIATDGTLCQFFLDLCELEIDITHIAP